LNRLVSPLQIASTLSVSAILYRALPASPKSNCSIFGAWQMILHVDSPSGMSQGDEVCVRVRACVCVCEREREREILGEIAFVVMLQYC